MKRFIMQGIASGEAISLNGRVLVHDNPEELEWLFFGIKVREVGDRFDLPTLQVKQLPQFEGVSWPLRRSEFHADTTSTKE